MASAYELDYAQLVREVLVEGEYRETRNAPTKATFGKMLTVNSLCWGQFPILSGRKMYYKGVFGELAAFLKGPNNASDFEAEGCNYWGKWADEGTGELRLDYGNAWLDFDGVNQLEAVLDSLATDPHGRRHIITGWDPRNLDNLSLPCCHMLYQWYVNGPSLEMIWYQRSVDMMIGLPSDVILAAAWNILMANHLGLNPGKLVFMLGDTHVYCSHVNKAMEYVDRVTKLSAKPVSYFCDDTFETFTKDSIGLIDYKPLDPITFELH